MALVKHNKLEAYIASLQKDEIPNLCLVYGESYLINQAFKIISSFLLGDEKSKFAVETLEGGFVSMGDIIEHVATFSFLVHKKIVAVKNIPLFHTPQSNTQIKFTPKDVDALASFIEKGLPENHFLLLTSSTIDKRRKIYKTIEKNGLIIDCSVPAGARKADQDEQRVVLQQIANQILARAKKDIDNQAFNALLELTGFDLDLFSQNMEKLITYSGKKSTITIAHVKTIIIRDKKDPIFNLTNAFMSKDVKKTLFYLNSLFNDGFHPLQILKSFENLIRKLILVKCFTLDFYRNNKNMSLKIMNFNSFKQAVLPKIVLQDKHTQKDLEEQEVFLAIKDLDKKSHSKEKKEPKKKTIKTNDLFLAPNPKNAYPVFQTFQKSDNFSISELNSALIFLSDLDYNLKSSSFDAKTQIEKFIMNTCSQGGFFYDEEDKNRRNNF
jgi:DNA polymerase III delta subunit